MRFGETPIDDATGAILAHSWRANGINFAKGRRLSAEDVGRLKAAGASSVIAARLDAGDMHEDEAAEKLARALAGEGIDVTAPFTGRCNLFAATRGLLVVDTERLNRLNLIDEAVTVATVAPFATASRASRQRCWRASTAPSRSQAAGIQFIAVQSSPDQQGFDGFWILRDLPDA